MYWSRQRNYFTCTWNGAEMKPEGTARIVIKNPKSQKKYSAEFVIVKGDMIPLIGARTAQQMKLITVNDNNFIKTSPPKQFKQPKVMQLGSTQEVLKKFEDVFSRPFGTLPGEIHIDTDPAIKPVITPPRRIPAALKEPLEKELKRLVELAVLEPVENPTPWVSSIAIETKKSGSLRICIDPRPLNKALMRETYQLPGIDELLPDPAQAKVFSTVDLKSGYWHCVLDEESSHLTTFATPFGCFRWLRLPFGLSVSSEIF